MALFAALAVSTASVRAQEAAGSATRSGEDLVYNGNTYEKLASAPSQNEDFTFYASACRQSSGEVYVRSVRGTSAENGVGAICMIGTGRAWYVWFPNAHPASDGQSLIFGDGTITEQYKNIIVAVQDRYERYDGFPASMAAAGEPKNLSIPNPKPAGLSEDEWVAMWSDVAQKFHANIQDQVRITIDGNGEGATTCSSEHTHGLGWIICPVTNLLADIMDRLYEQLEKFLFVTPLSTDRESPMYLMWNMVRNFANIMFIIGFLFIIYSQITSYGMSNYGLKRLLPRLLIAAVLVNISYWIVALAVDLSNVTGKTLYDALVSIRESAPKPQGVNYDFTELSWTTLASTILAGGAGGLLIGGAVFGVLASAGGSLWFLLVGLAGVITAGLIAVIILAARQALITILIIISPLAFVAYLLPSTEKYFDKWKDLLLTLLLVYPIFSVVFGGAQLAGLVIMQGATPETENAPIIIILGMIVQVAPVIITPLLIRVSGSLLGRIAGIVNNPNKGVIDQTRKFAQRRHDMTKNSMWASTGRDANGNIIYRRNDPTAMIARRKALRDIDYDHKLKALESGAGAAYEQDHRSHEVHLQSSINEMLSSEGSDAGKAAVSREIAHSEALRRLYMQQQVSHKEAELEESRNKTAFDAMTTSPARTDVALRDIANRAHSISVGALDETQRQSSIHQEHDTQYWRDLARSAERQSYAGAAGIADNGETRVANIVRQKQQEEREKRVNAAISNLSTVEARLSEERAVILGDVANAGRFVNLAEDTDSRSGALRRYVSRAPIEQVQSLLTEMDITLSANGNVDLETLRSELAGALQKRKPFYISQTILNKIEEGTLDTKYRGADGKTLMVKEILNAKGLGAETMVTADRDDLKAVRDYLRDYGIDSLDEGARKAIRDNLHIAFTDPRFSTKMDKRTTELEDIRRYI
jgi:hypothetical protein